MFSWAVLIKTENTAISSTYPTHFFSHFISLINLNMFIRQCYIKGPVCNALNFSNSVDIFFCTSEAMLFANVQGEVKRMLIGGS